jgi:hypothetical protein
MIQLPDSFDRSGSAASRDRYKHTAERMAVFSKDS